MERARRGRWRLEASLKGIRFFLCHFCFCQRESMTGESLQTISLYRAFFKTSICHHCQAFFGSQDHLEMAPQKHQTQRSRKPQSTRRPRHFLAPATRKKSYFAASPCMHVQHCYLCLLCAFAPSHALANAGRMCRLRLAFFRSNTLRVVELHAPALQCAHNRTPPA